MSILISTLLLLSKTYMELGFASWQSLALISRTLIAQSENSGAQWWRKTLQTNFQVILEGLNGFGSPLTLLKGDCLFYATIKRRVKGTPEQFGGMEGKCNFPEGRRERIVFPYCTY